MAVGAGNTLNKVKNVDAGLCNRGGLTDTSFTDPFQMETDGAAVETVAALQPRSSSTRQLPITRAAPRSPGALETESRPDWPPRSVPPLPRSKRPTPELAGTPDGRADACLS